MTGPSTVLILFAHPALEKSRVNVALKAAVEGLPGVRFHDLYEAYPDFHIDVAREQALLASHATVVFQHPFYWYSAPSLVKEWMDQVLELGWAYGEGGTALRGKRMLSAITTGGSAGSYHPSGLNRFTMREFLTPFEQTARLCGMEYLEPFIVHGASALATPGRLEESAGRFRARIEALCEGADAT